ncbi:hypothetical protein [Haloarcula pelagica]|uniref:hypothetical protein n=1 Tax=Haloarcula pelagica TaxID=3033389 RepID=UPI0024C25A65|nr:hypothetical protein [Halomicroarcula sp. YJ-61-S]
MLPRVDPPPAVVILLVGALVLVASAPAITAADGPDTDHRPRTVETTHHTQSQNTTATPTSSPSETATPTSTATPTATPTPTGTPTATPTTTPTATATPTATPTDTVTPTATPTTTNPQGGADGRQTASTSTTADASSGLVITDLAAPERVRPGETITVSATVANPASERRSERVEYVFAGSTVAARSVTLDGGQSQVVTFEPAAEASLTDAQSLDTGTYVHGVRNASGEGVPRYLRVTPDVDLGLDGFQSPVTAPTEQQFVVLGTVSNPSATTVTREVAYQFAGTTVERKTVTVGGGERKQVAFAVTAAAIDAAGVSTRTGTTYDHGLVTSGGASAGDAIRLGGGSSASADALATQDRSLPTRIEEGDAGNATITVRNVGTVPFDGQFVYRIGETVVATQRIELPTGQQRTVAFDAGYGAIQRATFPLSSPTQRQRITVGNESVASGQVTIERVRTPTPTPTPRGSPTFADDTDEAGGSAGTDGCSRGFFTRCGETSFDQMTLTLIGTVSSILGILYEMFTGG